MHFAVIVLLATWCALLTVSDIRHRRLPNVLTCSGALLIFGYALCTAQFTTALIGAGLLTMPYLLVHLAAPAAFGAGDVKLAVGLGAITALDGVRAWIFAALAAPLLTAAAGIIVLAFGRLRGGSATAHPLAHGPAMCTATLLALVAPHG